MLLLPLRVRAHPLFTYAGMILLVAISITTFFVDGLQWSFPAYAVFLAVISFFYLQRRRRSAAE